MAARWSPGPQPNRGGASVQDRARLVREWMEAEATEGRRCGEDEVWARVTSEWPEIGTQAAELVLAEAMRDVPQGPPGP